jgi:hypothetical protein
MSKRQILPSAEADFERIGHLYQIRAEMDEWCRQIAAEAHRDDRPMTGSTEIPIELVFANLEPEAATPLSLWARKLERFQNLNREDLSELQRRLSRQKRTWRLRLNGRVFGGLDGDVPVEVQVLYDVDRESGTATFVWFEA